MMFPQSTSFSSKWLRCVLAAALISPCSLFAQLAAYPSSDQIIIDGLKEDSYRTASATNWSSQTVDDADDLSAEISATYDGDGIYLFIDVTDDVFNQDDSASYQDDSIQFAFDPDNSDNSAGSYDGVNDIAFVARLMADGSSEVRVASYPTPPAGADDTGLDGKLVLTGHGYAAEIFIPWGCLQVDPIRDWNLGFGLVVNDDDGNDLSTTPDGIGDREGLAFFSEQGMNLNNHPHLFGDLTLLAPRTSIVRPTSTPMTIDGVVDSRYGTGNLCDRWIGDTHPADTSAIWRMRHDSENLYLVVEVVDSMVVAGESADSWQDDGLELFLDGDNSKSGAFDQVDDLKLAFRLTDLEGGLEVITDGHPDQPEGLDFSGLETAAAITGTGWNLEVKIPLSLISLDPVPGATFGIGLNIMDDDDGGDRDGTLTWSGGAAYEAATDLMGTAVLFSLNEAVIPASEAEISVDGQIDAAYLLGQWNPIERTYNAPLENDSAGYWIGAYDPNFLYLLFDVYDDVIVNDDAGSVYLDDGLEIFFDPSNDTHQPFDNVEDVKFSVGSPVEGQVRVVTEANYPPPPPGTDFTNLEVVWVETVLGWRVEMRIPWTTLRTNPFEGHDLAFDVILIDDDDGGTRDSNLSWSILGGNANQDPFNYGTLYLGGKAGFASFVGAANLAAYTFESGWLGQFHELPAYGSWIHHIGLEWLYTALAADPSAMWLYSDALDAWIYGGEELVPYIYVQGADWAYVNVDEEGNGHLFDYGTSDWVPIQ